MRFALSSSPVFSRTDTVTDSEKFYNSILDLFEDTEEKEEVDNLLMWWNRYVLVLAFLAAISPRILHRLDRFFPVICRRGVRLVKIVLWLVSRRSVLS
jgi:hypothetical protein